MSLKKYFSVFIATFLFSIVVKAQCTGCTFGIDGSINFTTTAANQTICITGGVPYTGTLTINHANTTICINTGNTMTNSANINFGGSFAVTWNNYGSWQKNFFTFDNNSIFNNYNNFGTTGAISSTVQGGSVFNNYANFGTSANRVNLSLNSTTTFNNFSSASAFTNNINSNQNATVNNYGTFNHSGNLSWNGQWRNRKNSSLTINGDLAINGNASIINEANAPVTVNGNLTNNNILTAGGNWTVSGNLTNNGSGVLTIQDAIIQVNGVGPGAGTNVTNNGTLRAAGTCGKLSIAGNSVQNGSGTTSGIGGALIDICDATQVGLYYDINFNNAGTSNLAGRCSCNPVNSLPVTFTFFKGVRVENKVKLSWQTSYEANNSHFTIEKSKDGQNFEILSVIDGAGNSVQIRDYSIFDTNPSNGINYYRISQTDANGVVSYYTKVVTVRITDQEVNISPNPTSNGLITISTGESFEELLVVIIETSGKIVQSRLLKNTSPEIDLNLQSLAKGIYFLKLSDRRTFSSKVYKIAIL
jgi:hypothetical protein